MFAKGFETGDLVWAKMKGFPPWPGKIASPSPETKIKKSHHYVFFYGTEDYAWIPDENISLHNEGLINKYAKGTKRPAIFFKAVEKIVNASKDSSKYQESNDSESSVNTEEFLPKTKSPQSNSAEKKKERKKREALKKSPEVKKHSKKRLFASEHNGEESSSIGTPSKVVRSEDDVLSNSAERRTPLDDDDDNDDDDDDDDSKSVHQSTGLLSRKAYIERSPTPPLNLAEVNKKLEKNNIEPTKKHIGFLGLGKMGRYIVKNLIHSGHSVTVWNRVLEKCKDFQKIGAKISETPYDVVLASDITFCCVSEPEAAKSLVFGNWGVLKALDESETKGRGYVEMTSLDPKTSIAAGDEIIVKGGRYLEAPLYGSRAEAEEGSLFVLCAGDRSLYDDCKTCFQAMARKSKFINRNLGTAYKFNIIHSMLVGTVYAAFAESLALIQTADLDPADFFDILQYGILNNPEFIRKGNSMTTSNYTSDTPIKHQQKEINFAVNMGGNDPEEILSTPIASTANEVYKHCMLLRYGDHDVSAIFEGTRR